jgi:endo-1,4-beta-xylanase
MRKPGVWTRREFGRWAAQAGLSASCLPALGFPGPDKKRTSDTRVPVSGADSLRAHATAVGLLSGCAAVPERLNLVSTSTDPYTRTVTEQSSILVAENAMKWSSLRPSPTTYEFSQADKLVQFAAVNGQLVRGHNLCWHEQLPPWFATYATKENARQLLTEHIERVAGRYAGRMHSWDVVNEAVHVPDGRPDGLRKSPWLELIGPEYLELAFTTAVKADPHAKLTYNDYDIELDTPEQSAKRAQVLMLVRRLHARGVPIQALGIQSHLQANGPRPGAGVVSLIRSAADMGLEVYITELDVNTHALPGGPELQDAAVADVYRSYLDLVLREPNVKAVLTWGITDAYTWLNQSKQAWALRPDGARQRPLPFDDDYAPTPAFFAMRDAYDAAKHTAAFVDASGKPKPAETFAPFAVPGSPGTGPSVVPKPQD